MKLLSPIRGMDELEMLLAAGAEELYCGIAPPEWQSQNSGPLWIHRRSPKGSSVESYEDLRALTDAAHRSGVPVFVTLNAPSYSATQIESVLAVADRVSEECGVDAIIAADMNLIVRWSDRQRNAKLHVSSVASALNTEAVMFYADLGAHRVILPRSVTLSEIDAIANAARGQMEIEVFLLNDGCAFEEGFCSTTHHHSVGAFCTALGQMQVDYEWHGAATTSRRHRWLLQNHAAYHKWIWYLNGNGCSSAANGLPYGPCGLCALPELARSGVASLKIVGRESSAFKKYASVRMARDVLDRTRGGDSRAAVRERARSLRREPEHCDAGYMCYYRVDADV